MSKEREEEGSAFKVVDRRRFTSSGDTREGAPDQAQGFQNESRSSTEPRQSPTTTPASSMSEGRPSTRAPEEPVNSTEGSSDASRAASSLPHTPDAAKSEIERSYAAEGETSVEFSEFVLSLATQAMVLLGEMPDPHTRQMAMNLDAARQTIDILGAIEKKTKGNLTGEEAHLLSEALATIRLAFVRKSRPAHSSK